MLPKLQNSIATISEISISMYKTNIVDIAVKIGLFKNNILNSSCSFFSVVHCTLYFSVVNTGVLSYNPEVTGF